MNRELADLIASFAEQPANGQTKKSSGTALDELYLMAYNFYNNGKYHDAQHCFRMLVTADGHSSKYWTGLGATHQMLKEYKDAIGAYALATMLDKTDPYIHLYAAECFFAEQQGPQGLNALKTADQLAKGKEQYAQLVSRIALMRKSWQEKQRQES
jgi:secretion system chaperone SscA